MFFQRAFFVHSAKSSLIPENVRTQLSSVLSSAMADARTRVTTLGDEAVAFICALPKKKLRKLAIMVRFIVLKLAFLQLVNSNV